MSACEMASVNLTPISASVFDSTRAFACNSNNSSNPDKDAVNTRATQVIALLTSAERIAFDLLLITCGSKRRRRLRSCKSKYKKVVQGVIDYFEEYWGNRTHILQVRWHRLARFNFSLKSIVSTKRRYSTTHTQTLSRVRII